MVELLGGWIEHLGVTGCAALGAPAALSGFWLRHRARRALHRLRALRARLRPIGSLHATGPATVMGDVVSVEGHCALLRDPAGSMVLVSLRERAHVGDRLLVDGVASHLRPHGSGYRDARRLWLIDARGDAALARRPISRPQLLLQASAALFGGALFTAGVALIANALVSWLA